MERRIELVALTERDVAHLVSEAVPGTRVRSSALLSGGRANTNHRVETEDGCVVLRLYTRDPRARDREAALSAWLDDVPVPGVLGAGESPFGPFAVLEHMPGQQMAEACEAFGEAEWSAAGAAIGRALAKIHARTFDAFGDLQAAGESLVVEPWPFEGGAGGFIRHCLFETPAGERLGASRRDALWELVQRLERELGEASVPALTHGDFNPTNLLVDGTGNLTAVLDWEFAHAGDPAMDLGNLLRQNPRRNPPPPDSFVAALAGELDLPDGWRRRAEFLDLTSALEFLSSSADRPETHRQSIRQIDAFLRERDA